MCRCNYCFVRHLEVLLLSCHSLSTVVLVHCVKMSVWISITFQYKHVKEIFNSDVSLIGNQLMMHKMSNSKGVLLFWTSCVHIINLPNLGPSSVFNVLYFPKTDQSGNHPSLKISRNTELWSTLSHWYLPKLSSSHCNFKWLQLQQNTIHPKTTSFL